MGACALHTVTGRNSRRHKGLEPSQRLNLLSGTQLVPLAALYVELSAGELHSASARERLEQVHQRCVARVVSNFAWSDVG